MIKFFKKYHKWISIVFTLIIVLFSVSGIILNHRQLLSGIDVSRNILPAEYRYNNWNNGAVVGTLKISSDSILIYGNIGIWYTDSTFSTFSDFNIGFPNGIDNRKITSMYLTENGDLLAGTFFGLFKYDYNSAIWEKLIIPVRKERITDIIQVEDSVLVLTRSYLLTTTDFKSFSKKVLPEPTEYDNKVGLFKTLWVIHSGEIYGETGKIIVDIMGLILAFLTVSGFIVFVNRIILRRNRIPKRKKKRKIRINIFTLKWHNKIGWITLIFLVITTVTGMFLRPPLLIGIANSKVSKIPYSELDSDNPWFDRLRKILYDKDSQQFILATSEGFYYSDDNFKTKVSRFKYQPPASIMGVSVLKKFDKNTFMVGSFEGLFLWNPQTGIIFDYIEKQVHITPLHKSRPLGSFLVTGFTNSYDNNEIVFDYNSGAIALSANKAFTEMPNVIREQPMSLWNVALEVHTARIFQSLLGGFYILVVPITGLAVLFVLISGFVVWFVRYRKW